MLTLLRGGGRVWGLPALLLAGGCSGGSGGAPPLPDAVLDWLRPSSVSAFRVDGGVWYREVLSPEGPWAVHLLEVDLSRCELGFSVLPGEREEWGGFLRVTDMLRGGSGELLAAVNGDFFTPEGRPLGPEISGGRIRSRSPRPVFSWSAGRGPWIGPVDFSLDSVAQLGWPLSRARPDGLTQAVGGFPQLLSGGARVGDLLVGGRPDFAAERHPRTAVGFDLEQERLWLVVVDGRQAGWSDGMTLPELTRLLEGLGVQDALNLDGGGSSVMIVRGRRMSRPSHVGGERAVVNGLALRSEPAYCDLP